MSTENPEKQRAYVGFKTYSAKPHAWGKKKTPEGNSLVTFVGGSYELDKYTSPYSGPNRPEGYGSDD